MMKHFYIVLIVGLVFIYFSFKSLGFHYLSYESESIEVSVVYRGHHELVRLDNYSLLEEVILPLEDDEIDYSKLNLKQILSDGDVITVPLKSDTPCISINTATVEELGMLNGVGPKTAEAIILYRQENGLFQTVEALMEVKGIGPKKFEKMANQLCL